MEKLVVIRTLQQLEELKEYLKDKQIVAFDTETTGVSKESVIIGFSVCADIGDNNDPTGYYVILRYWDVEAQKLKDLETCEGAKAFLGLLKGKDLVMHNAVFDCWMVENNYQTGLIESIHTDTMILAHLLDENRAVGLKELGVAIYGEDARKEQAEMKESVTKNGGSLTKACYELYKADAELLARYGAKDAILTLKLFYHMVPELYEQELDRFFYEDECMPLLKGPTYDLNTVGLNIDPEKLAQLKKTLEAECMEAKAFIYKEITPHVMDQWIGVNHITNAQKFNIGSSKQLSWLLFERLRNEFHTLTKEGRELCKALDMKLPYTSMAKHMFIQVLKENNGKVWAAAKMNPKTKKLSRPKVVGNYWNYLACGKETLGKYAKKYKWVETFLQYAKNLKLLTTYVEGIESRMQYNVIRPSFLQHGTTSGRYSSRNPNFQNLPRKDKRVKSCIVARPGKIFVGADYSQLEPRVFASFSGDEKLLNCFKNGDDFYSVVGMEVFEKYDCSLKKDDKDSFANKYPDLRDASKVIALSAAYGTTAPKMAPTLNRTMDQAQEIIDNYFEKFPKVEELMLDSHAIAKRDGRVVNLFGRPRRMPLAKEIINIYGNRSHKELPYETRNILNLAMNHRIQSTGASIMNRAAISVWHNCRRKKLEDPRWAEVKIILQVHDEVILEGPEALANDMVNALKDAMENTVTLPGVDLIAEPKIAKNIADLK